MATPSCPRLHASPMLPMAGGHGMSHGRAIDVGAGPDRVRQRPRHRVQPDDGEDAEERRSTIGGAAEPRHELHRLGAAIEDPVLHDGEQQDQDAAGSWPSPAHSRPRGSGTRSRRRRWRPSRWRATGPPPVMIQTMSKMRRVPRVRQQHQRERLRPQQRPRDAPEPLEPAGTLQHRVLVVLAAGGPGWPRDTRPC